MNTELSRQRLSREQSRALTRERLLEAAHTLFVEKGFALASVEDIAGTAGYSRGAFYSNFADKTELFVELLRREADGVDLDFQRLLAVPQVDANVLREQVAQYYSRLYQSDLCSVLWMEAKFVAVRDEKFRMSLSVFLEERHAQLARFVDTFARLTNVPFVVPSHHIAVGLMALGEGIRFAHRCDPQRLDEETVQAVLSWFLKTVMGAGREPH